MTHPILQQAQAIRTDLVRWRRTIHQTPELGFGVHRSARLVADTLAELSIEAQTGVGRSGVVGTMGNGRGPVIALRADLDALPIQEENDVPYASEIPGVMHACGHDAHTAILLGAARLLSRQRLPGQVRLLFQPSEEMADDQGVSGAPLMIADGALDGVDAVIALHVDGSLDTGHICVGDGWVGAAADLFQARILGQGGHGAYPHNTVDPIWLASHVLSALYAIPSRQIAPLEPSVVSVGIIRAGAAENVIPGSVYLEGTLRSFTDDVREQLIVEVERAMQISRALGGDYTLNIDRGYPATRNDPVVAGWLRQVGADLLGQAHVSNAQRSMGAEDFSFMSQRKPGAIFNLGVKLPGAPPRHLHTGAFDLDENALPIGAALLAETALRFVRGEWGK